MYHLYFTSHKNTSAAKVIMLVSSAIGHVFEPWSGQIKDDKIGISCFSTNHAVLRRKSKNWLARNQDNVFDWGDMSILHGLVSMS
jgi:hypothetical protein